MEEKIVVQKPPKSPFLAALLAVIFPGTGALYNKEYLKGAIYIIIFAGLVTLQTQGSGQPFAGLLLAGFYFFQVIDSINVARSINRRALHGELVEEEKVPEFNEAVKAGSIFWGILLIALGGILLLGNFEVLSYDKIFDFWPLVVIVIGGKLILDYFTKEK